VDYNQIIDYLFNQLANYQKQGEKAYKPGLENIQNLLSRIGSPHKDLKTIHIAGTNGKGSTSHILASILIENGYKVGLFTSPHIKDFRERFKINGQLISKELVLDFVNTNQSIFEELNPSFFEICTALAFSIFKSQNCEISIIETGLGGRLDSTNVIKPEISVITNIGLDHTNFLGTTLTAIATEKAGIIKKNVPVVIGEYTSETFKVFNDKAYKNRSQIYYTEHNSKLKTDLLGLFQQKNCALALKTISVLKMNGLYIDDAKVKLALNNVKRNTNFKGRLELISNKPRIIVDASHNIDGIKNLFKEIEQMKFKNLICVYATSNDKNVKEIMQIFPKEAKYYLTKFNSKRTMSLVELEKHASNNNLNFELISDQEIALSLAKESCKSNDIVLVFGSFFLLEKII